MASKNTPAPDATETSPPQKITYNLSFFLQSERTKELKKRTGKNTFLKLEDIEPFDTWKAQLLVLIDKHLSPPTLDIDNYEINFTVPRISTAPMSVSCEDEYSDMLERVKKGKENVCTVYVQELIALSATKASFTVSSIPLPLLIHNSY